MISVIAAGWRAATAGALCATLIVGAGCSQAPRDPLEEIRSLHGQGQYEESLERLRARMDDDPTDPEVNYLFGRALVLSGEPSLAIWPLSRATESPEYAFDAWMLIARATLYSRTPEDAVAAADAALAVEPDNVEALVLRAHANFKAARYDAALADVERAVALGADPAALLVPRVLVLLEFQRVEEAEALLAASEPTEERADEPPGEDIQARLCLTNAAFAVERGDRKSAEVMYADCLDAYPTDERVVLQVVDFYDSIGPPKRATALLQRTFEETRAARFGYELARRARMRADERRSVPPPLGELSASAGGAREALPDRGAASRTASVDSGAQPARRAPRDGLSRRIEPGPRLGVREPERLSSPALDSLRR